ncbi:copper amine oxidase [Brevibacterium zhoupengii]|uniref:copper amine oxidase n=1 Tax=Brevibacterium zhoupengii TaxID=2898795 RepID=UPI001F09B4EF|nr:copper amine oxidase [Brevibacterium zhoupengii]
MSRHALTNRRLLQIVTGGLCLVLFVSACTRGDTSPKDAKTADSSAVASSSCKEPAKKVSQTLSSGATWTMCWGVHPDFGLTLSEVFIAPPGKDPIRVIDSASIAQLEVPYDTGKRNTSDITAAGFGGRKMKTLKADACAGDLNSMEIPKIGDGKYGESETRNVLCTEVIDDGLAYHSSDLVAPASDRKNALRLSTVSRVGWYEYVSQYTFGSDGSIDVQLGATGDLSPADYTDKDHGWDVGDDEHAASHSHNAVWKVRWGLGGEGNMKAQQFDATPTGESGPESPIMTGKLKDIEHPTLARWKDRRWWRVLNPDVLNDDGHPISYEIDTGKSDSFEFVDDVEHAHSHEEEPGYDVGFTNFSECEQYATNNRGDCGRGVPEFVDDGKGQKLDDVVSWVAVGFHHVPRDEEQSPMEMHWQGFKLLPRDLTAQRFDIPDGHEEVNGVPDSEWNQEPTN